MSKKKRKVLKLTDEQYNAYIATLKDGALPYDDDKQASPQVDANKSDNKNE